MACSSSRTPRQPCAALLGYSCGRCRLGAPPPRRSLLRARGRQRCTGEPARLTWSVEQQKGRVQVSGSSRDCRMPPATGCRSNRVAAIRRTQPLGGAERQGLVQKTGAYVLLAEGTQREASMMSLRRGAATKPHCRSGASSPMTRHRRIADCFVWSRPGPFGWSRRWRGK